jgi:hypothetical protein
VKFLSHPIGRFLVRLFLLPACILVSPFAAAFADDLTVPSALYPTLQDAVDEAADNGDIINTIYINGVVTIGATITLEAADFGGDRFLTFRPVATAERATIEMIFSFALAFDLDWCSNVTFRDLDIVRNNTNGEDLIELDNAEYCVFERCRIGSIWTTPGMADKNVMRVFYPKEVVIRNCILFAYFPGTFARSLYITGLTDDDRSLFLYNNVFADHLTAGIDADGGPGPIDALLLLRNNVVVNHPDLVAEPFAFHSNVSGITIETTHNVAFASAANVEDLALGAEPISGETLPGGEFLRFDRDDVDDTFIERTWIVLPPWEPNSDFFILQTGAANPLHDDAGDYGQTVDNGAPYVRDKAVRNDIEQDGRPSGLPLHTDRGVDQLEPGVSSSVGPLHPVKSLLWAFPRRNASGSPSLLYRVAAEGRLELEIFDPAGRRVYAERRNVVAGEEGIFTWSGRAPSGVMFYRVRLETENHVRAETKGKVLTIK